MVIVAVVAVASNPVVAGHNLVDSPVAVASVPEAGCRTVADIGLAVASALAVARILTAIGGNSGMMGGIGSLVGSGVKAALPLIPMLL